MIPNHIVDSVPYKALKPGPRALLLELIRLFNGNNNGRLALSQRVAAKRLNLGSADTAGKYFAELLEKGFIAVVRSGAFSIKSARQATEYRLTWPDMNSGRHPTHDYKKWKPK